MIQYQPLLVLGRDTVPTSEEYAYTKIPIDLAHEITDKKTAQTFKEEYEKALEKQK